MSNLEATLHNASETPFDEPIKAGDLDFYSLLRRQADEGYLFFNQRRAVIFDVEALGTLRQQLIDTLGQDLAKGILTRFGHTQGHKEAEILGQTFTWESETEWLSAGSWLHTLEGMVHVETQQVEFNRETGDFYMQGIWRNSYEAEEHLRRYGPSDTPVCWTLGGYTSGYATHFFGHELLAIETECIGKGDKQCRWEIKPVAEWGTEAETHLKTLKQVNISNDQLLDTDWQTIDQTRQLTLINEMALDLNLATTIDETFNIVAVKTKQVITTDRASVTLLNPDGKSFQVFALDDKSDANPQGITLSVDESTGIGRALKAMDVIITYNIQSSTATENEQMAKRGFHTALVAPLITSGRAIGTLNVASKTPGAYGEYDKKIMLQLASLLASAIENQRLIAQTQQRAVEFEENANFLNSILDNIPTLVAVKEAQDLRFVRWNKAGEELLGFKREDLIGKNDYDFFSKEEADLFIAKDREVLTGGQLVDIPEESIQTADGDTRLLYTRKVPILDADGEPKYLLGISEDITERMKTEQALLKRATELETVAEVGTVASTVLETTEILQTVADLTKERFDLYHAHIYLLNPAGDRLELAAGAGEIGQQMVTERWGIALIRQRSLVARTAREQQGVIVNDVETSLDFLSNPLLPDTRSEMAVPIKVGDKFLGVLDVQSEEVNHFTTDDIRIQTTLASQVAVALENARLFEAARKSATEIEDQAHRLALLNEMSAELNQVTGVDEVFKIAATKINLIFGSDRASVGLVTSTRDKIRVSALQGVAGSISHSVELPIEGTFIGKVVQENQAITIPDLTESTFPEHRQLAKEGLRSVIISPLAAGGQVIGTINMASKQLNAYTLEDKAVLLQMASLLATTFESQRLFEQTEEALAETEVLYNVLQAVSRQRDMEQLLETIYEQVQRIILADAFFVGLYANTTQLISYPLVYDEGQRHQKPPVSVLPGSNIEHVLKTGEPVFINRTPIEMKTLKLTSERAMGNENKSSASLLFVPLQVGEKVIGVMSAQSYSLEAYSERDLTLLGTIANQVSVTIENVRLYNQAQARARRERVLREVTAQVRNSIGVDTIMRTAAQKIGQALDRPAFVYLDSENNKKEV